MANNDSIGTPGGYSSKISAPGSTGTLTGTSLDDTYWAARAALNEDAHFVLAPLSQLVDESSTLSIFIEGARGVLCTVLKLNLSGDGYSMDYVSIREVGITDEIDEPMVRFVWHDLDANQSHDHDESGERWLPIVTWTQRPAAGSWTYGAMSRKSNIVSALKAWDTNTPCLLLTDDARAQELRRSGNLPPNSAPIIAALAKVERFSPAGEKQARQLVTPADGVTPPEKVNFRYYIEGWVLVDGARKDNNAWVYRCKSLPLEDRPASASLITSLYDAMPGMVTQQIAKPGDVFNIKPQWDLDLGAVDDSYSVTRRLVLVNPVISRENTYNATVVEVIRTKSTGDKTFTVRAVESVIATGLVQLKPYTVFGLSKLTDVQLFDSNSDSPGVRLSRYLDKLKFPLSEIEQVRQLASENILPKAVADLVKAQFSRIEELPSYSGERGPLIEYTRTLITLPWNEPDKELPNSEAVRQALDTNHYGLINAKSRAIEFVAGYNWRRAATNSGKVARRSVLLVGAPGTGKTSFAHSFAKSLGQPMFLYSMADLTGKDDLLGTTRAYNNAHPGVVINAILNNQTRHLVVCLDEVDKIPKYANNDPTNLLLSLLDPDNSSTLTDSYLQIPFDISGITFVLTANSLASVHPAVLDRCDIIQTETYSSSDKQVILRQYIMPKIYKETATNSDIISIDSSAYELLSTQYSEELGVRNMELAARRVIDNAILSLSAGATSVQVDADLVQKYLGTDSNFVPRDEVANLKFLISHGDAPEAVKQKVIDELERASDKDSLESANIRAWARTMVALPWSEKRALCPQSLAAARSELNSGHLGMEFVKQRVMDRVTAVSWRQQHNSTSQTPQLKSLLLVGPPGTGKTSILKSIGRALGRSTVIVPCGSFADATGLAGSERVYVSSRPGAIIDALQNAGTSQIVLGLDEIDKMSSGSFNGNPLQILLEITDPQQNQAFTDRWLTVPVDISQIFMVATANDLSGLSAPLLDRFDIVEVRGYSLAEKIDIAQQHIIPKLRLALELDEADVLIDQAIVETIINNYALESGLRRLTNSLETVLLRAAGRVLESNTPVAIDRSLLRTALGAPQGLLSDLRKIPTPGYMPILFVVPSIGQGNVGAVEVRAVNGTGRLLNTGTVEREIVETNEVAITYVRSNAANLGLDLSEWNKQDIHIHQDRIGIYKDGPSGGVATVTALVSMARNQAVIADTVVTGEVSLDGRVLAVGGIPEKLVAAHRAGAKLVLIPFENTDDTDDLPEDVRRELKIVTVKNVSEALEILLPVDSAV